MPKAGAVIGHGVGRTGNVVILGKVTMMTLVESTEATQMGRDVNAGNGAFCHAAESGGVVTERGDGALTNIPMLGNDVLVSNHAGLFQIAVGDGASGIVGGNQKPLD